MRRCEVVRRMAQDDAWDDAKIKEGQREVDVALKKDSAKIRGG